MLSWPAADVEPRNCSYMAYGWLWWPGLASASYGAGTSAGAGPRAPAPVGAGAEEEEEPPCCLTPSSPWPALEPGSATRACRRRLLSASSDFLHCTISSLASTSALTSDSVAAFSSKTSASMPMCSSPSAGGGSGGATGCAAGTDARAGCAGRPCRRWPLQRRLRRESRGSRGSRMAAKSSRQSCPCQHRFPAQPWTIGLLNPQRLFE